MLGKVIFRQGPTTLEASLDEETSWHCQDAQMESFLNQSFRWSAGCGLDESPAVLVLCQAAAVLNGQAVYE
jgi:hypothetical protein